MAGLSQKVTQCPLGSVSEAHSWVSRHDVRKPMPHGGAMGSYLGADPTADHTEWALWGYSSCTFPRVPAQNNSAILEVLIITEQRASVFILP